MMRKIFTLFTLSLLVVFNAWAQDPQFSQFYANPLYTNPALAGSDEVPRIHLNWRQQWPSLEASFQTTSGSFDFYSDKLRSGFGILYVQDESSKAGWRMQDLGLQYAYDLDLTGNVDLRFGMQASYTTRDLNYARFRFGDQFQESTKDFTGSTQENLAGNDRRNGFNLSSGIFIYSEKFWVGVSAHNMTRPRQDIITTASNSTSTESRLPVRYTVQMGMTFPLDKFSNYRDRYRAGYKERSFTPTLLYRHQGPFDQLDAGAYLTLEPIVFGLWYRGIPIKEYEVGLGNNESLIGLVGIQIGTFDIGYSYDYTISNLGRATGGAHELSLRFDIGLKQRFGTKRTSRRPFPCPHF